MNALRTDSVRRDISAPKTADRAAATIGDPASRPAANGKILTRTRTAGVGRQETHANGNCRPRLCENARPSARGGSKHHLHSHEHSSSGMRTSFSTGESKSRGENPCTFLENRSFHTASTPSGRSRQHESGHSTFATSVREHVAGLHTAPLHALLHYTATTQTIRHRRRKPKLRRRG